MTTATVTCPYCNALVEAPESSGGQRVSCPRCGEAFTPSPNAVAALPAFREQVSAEATVAENAERRPAYPWLLNKPVRANRRLALLIVGVMVCVAGVGLAYALATVSYRRENDKGIVKTSPKRRRQLEEINSPDNTPTPPAKLAALGWLPPKTSVVIGVNVRELVGSEAGKALLTQPVDVGEAAVRLQTLASWTGFTLDDIDHLVLGIEAEEALPPPLFLIVHTRRDVEEPELRQRLKAERAGQAGQRVVYQYPLANAPLPKLSFCRVDARTVVYAYLPDHLKELPETPAANLKQLPPAVRDALEKRLDPAASLWLAGHADDWTKTLLPQLAKLLFKNMTDKERELLLKITTFAAGIQPENPAIVRAAFDCGDDETAQQVQKYLHVPDAGVDADWAAARADGWLTLQIRTSLAKVRAALER